MNEMRVASIALAAYFMNLGRARVHVERAFVVAVERRVEALHQFARAAAGGVVVECRARCGRAA